MRLWNKRIFLYSMISSLLWGVTHAYAVTRLMLSHDSLTEFFAGAGIPTGYTGLTWKIALGRFVTPVYEKLFRGTVCAPWLIGMLAMLFAALAVYVTVRVLDFRRPAAIFLTAGVMIANPAVFTTAATFLHDLDCYMLALLLAALAVWCWQRGSLLYGAGALCICLCMGLYASYLSVAIVLMMLVSILRLTGGEAPGGVVVRGLKGIGVLIAGLALYALATACVCRVSGVALLDNTDNSILNILGMGGHLAKRLGECYRQVGRALVYELFGHGDAVSPAALGVLAGVCCALAARMIRSRIGVPAVLLTLVLAALLPAAMNLSMLANNGSAHDLMKYAFLLPTLLALTPLEALPACPGRPARVGATALALCVGLVSWQYVVQANQIYLKKELEDRYTYSFMTRLLTRIEQTEGFSREETPVLLIGRIDPMIQEREELARYRDYTGQIAVTPITFGYQYRMYLEYMLGTPVYVDTDAEQMAGRPEVEEMGVYPSPDAIRMIDGTLVVKLEQGS